MGKKKFINKKKAVTFSLLYRESNDGERVTNDRVYTRVDNNAVQIPGFQEEEEEDYDALKEFDVDSMFADAEEDDKENSSREGKRTRIQLGGDSQKGQLPDNIRKELLEMGFPDDGYNYMKHLRSFGVGVVTPQFVPNQAPVLPTDIKAYDASKLKLANANETDSLQVSTSTQQIRRPSVANDGFDPEVAAALENEGSIFDSADELEDDFLVNANEFSDDPTTETQDRADKANDIEGFSSVTNVEDTEWDGDNCSEEVPTAEATRSLRLLDEQFEMLALREYEGDEIEDLEDNDLLAQGCMDVSKFDAVLSEFLNDTSFFAEKYETVTNSSLILDEGKKPDIRKRSLGSKDEGIVQVDHKGISREDHKDTSESIQSLSETDETEEETEDVWVEASDHEEQWDCETIVSTYSNLENHPCKIVTPGNPGKARLELDTIKIKASTNQMIKLAGKQKLPVDFLPSKGIEKIASQVKSEVGVHGHNKKAGPRGGETAEERKCRKAALKEERRLARITKKECKGQYKKEARKAQVGAATTGPPAIHLP